MPNEKRFLGGETIGELFDRVLPALERLSPTTSWDTVLLVLHGAVNRAILSYALTGQRMFLGHFEQSAGCVNVLDVGDEWIVRAVNVNPTDPAHRATRKTTMEGYWERYRGRATRRRREPETRRGRRCRPRRSMRQLSELRLRARRRALRRRRRAVNVPSVNFTSART